MKDEEAIQRFLERYHRKEYPAKTTIIRQGDPPHDLFYIVKGSVSVMLEDEEGRELVLAYLNPGDFFEETANKCDQPKKAANWIVNDLLRELSAAGDENGPLPLDESKVTPVHVAELVSLVEGGSISSNIAKEIFPEIFASGKMPSVMVEEKGLKQTSDVSELETICSQVITDHPKAVEEFKGGKENAINSLKGQVMKATRGQANPKLVDDILRKLLSS